jgi:hypothetical protein
MKKITTLLCVAALCICTITRGETPVISMTTSMAVGSAFTIQLTTSVPNTVIQIDFGDGSLVDKTISTRFTIISGTLAGSQIVKIYGTGITEFICEEYQLTTLDVTNCTTLTFLNCQYNQLTNLDVTKNTALLNLLTKSNQLTAVDVTNNTALNYLDFSSNKLTSLDISKNTALFQLGVAGNQIASLDLGNLTSLMNLYCNSNPLTTLDVTKNTSLLRLYCWGDQLTSLDVTKNTSLQELGCGFNKITALDLSKNAALTFLDCSNSQLTTLDVSKNSALAWLYCDHNQLTALDVSFNSYLQGLYVNHNQLNSIEVTKNTVLNAIWCQNNQITSLNLKNNTALAYLVCSFNKLTSLDISKNASLVHLFCDNNQLTSFTTNTALVLLQCQYNQFADLNLSLSTSLLTLYCFNNKLTFLDLSNNTKLTDIQCEENQLATLNLGQNALISTLYCNNNKLTFATMPLNSVSYNRKYAPQERMPIAATLYTGVEFDLSSQNIGEWTVYTWKTKGGATLETGTDYTLTNGKTIFLKAQSDSVYCEMTNGLFADFQLAPLRTTYTMVKDIPVMTMVTEKPLGSTINLYLKASAPNTQVQIYFGDHNPVIQTVGISGASISGTIALLQVVKVSGSGITYLLSNGNGLTSLDVTQNTELATLYCDDNQLTMLDVSKNTALKSLSCSSNQLTFTTLPVKQIFWTTYYYAPQKPISIGKSLATGIDLDLSSQLTVNSNTTVYTWKTKSGATLVQGTDYSLTDGRTIFLKSQADSVYCEMTNATFPLFTGDDVLKTTFAKVSINTGIDNINSPAVQIYTQNKTLFVVATNNGQASVYDINGRLAMTKEISTGTNTIAIQRSGVYLVRLTGHNTPVIKKVFVGN